ncbi:hypothetical protein HDZ31DRAFT_38497 [Schizophyllum fasciatum]
MSGTGFARQPGAGQRQLHDIKERPKDEGAQPSVPDDEHDNLPLISRRLSASPRMQALQQSSAYVFPSYPSPIFEEDAQPDSEGSLNALAHSKQAMAAMHGAASSQDELQVPEPSEAFVVPGSPASPVTPSPPSPSVTASSASAVAFDTHVTSPSPSWDATSGKPRPRYRQRSSVGPNTNFCLPRSYSSSNLRPLASPSPDRQPLATIPSPRLLPDEAIAAATKSPPSSSDHHLRRARSASCTVVGSAPLSTAGPELAHVPGVAGRQRSGSIRDAVYIPDQHTPTAAMVVPSPEPEVLRVSTSTESSRFSAVTSFSAYSGISGASRYSSDVPLTPDDVSEQGTHLQKLYRISTPPAATLPEEEDDGASVYSAQTDGSAASSTYSFLAQALPANISKSVADGAKSRPAYISLDEDDAVAENSPLEGPYKADPLTDARSSNSGGSRRRTKSTPRPPPIATPSRHYGLPNIEIETPLPESRPDSCANAEWSSQASSRPGSRHSSRTPMPAAAFALHGSRSSSSSRPSSRQSLRHAASFAHSPRVSTSHPSSQSASPPTVLTSPQLRAGHQPRSSSLSSPHSPRFSGMMHSPRSSSLSHVYDESRFQQQQQPQQHLPARHSPSVSRQTSASRLSTAPPRQGFSRHASTPVLRYSPSPSLSASRHSPGPSVTGARYSPSLSFSGGTPPRAAMRSSQSLSSMASPAPSKRTSLRPSASTIAALLSARSSLIVSDVSKPQRAPYTRSRTDSEVNYLGGDVMDISAINSHPPSVTEEDDDASVYSNDDEAEDVDPRECPPPWAATAPPADGLSPESEMAEPFRRATPDPNARLMLVPLEEAKPDINVTLALPASTAEAPVRRTSFGDISDDPFACLSSGATVVSAAGEGALRPPSIMRGGSSSRPSSLVGRIDEEPATASAESNTRPVSRNPAISTAPNSSLNLLTPDVLSPSGTSTSFDEASGPSAPSTPRPRASSRADSARSVRFQNIDRPGSSSTSVQQASLAPTPEYEPSVLSSKPPSMAGRSSHRSSYRPSTSDSSSKKSDHVPKSPPPDFLNSSLFAYQQRPHSSRASSSRGSRESQEKKERLKKSEERARPSTADDVVDDNAAGTRKTGFFSNFRLRRKHDSLVPAPHPSPKALGKQRVEPQSPAPSPNVLNTPSVKSRGGGGDKRSHFFS